MRIQRISTVLIASLLLICALSQQTSQQSQSLEAASSRSRSRPSSNRNLGVLGFVVGPFLFICSFAGIWFNEKRAAVNYRRFKLAEQLLQKEETGHEQELPALGESFIKSNQKRLVHKVGQSQVLEPARDEQCQVAPEDAIVLIRKVEVKEMRYTTKKTNDGEQEFQYHLEWVSENITQCGDQYNSYLAWFVENQQFYSNTTVAEYFLNQNQMKRLSCETDINPSPETISIMASLSTSTGHSTQPVEMNGYLYFPAEYGNIESRGSLRVKFIYCKSTELSIMSTVNPETRNYEPFRIDIVDNNGQEDENECANAQCCVCCEGIAVALKPITEIDLILKGFYNYHQMVAISVMNNGRETNLLRVCFFFLMVIGICIFFNPVVDLFGYIPLVGGFLKGVAAMAIFLGAFIISIPLFSLTFGLAWLRYHPLIGGVATVSALVAIIVLSQIQK